MARRPASDSNTELLADIVISEPELAELSPSVLVDRLIARGVSRLTAERFVEIQRGTGEPGRARSHPISRR
jgi:hypothetical protein